MTCRIPRKCSSRSENSIKISKALCKLQSAKFYNEKNENLRYSESIKNDASGLSLILFPSVQSVALMLYTPSNQFLYLSLDSFPIQLHHFLEPGLLSPSKMVCNDFILLVFAKCNIIFY